MVILEVTPKVFTDRLKKAESEGTERAKPGRRPSLRPEPLGGQRCPVRERREHPRMDALAAGGIESQGKRGWQQRDLRKRNV